MRRKLVGHFSFLHGLAISKGATIMGRAALCVAFLFPAFAHAQATRLGHDLWVRELSTLLARPVSTAEFQVRQTLKDALATLERAFRRQGLELPIGVDEVAFKEENPDAPDVCESSVKMSEFPRTLPAGRLLGILISQIPTNNGSYRIMPGVVQITTLERTSMTALLSSPVQARFQQRPLHVCLEDLYEQCGVAVMLDPRVGPLARRPVTMSFSSETSLGTVLLLMSETCGLKMLVSEEAILITTPTIARRLILEDARNPYRLPEWTAAGRARRVDRP